MESYVSRRCSTRLPPINMNNRGPTSEASYETFKGNLLSAPVARGLSYYEPHILQRDDPPHELPSTYTVLPPIEPRRKQERSRMEMSANILSCQEQQKGTVKKNTKRKRRNCNVRKENVNSSSQVKGENGNTNSKKTQNLAPPREDRVNDISKRRLHETEDLRYEALDIRDTKAMEKSIKIDDGDDENQDKSTYKPTVEEVFSSLDSTFYKDNQVVLFFLSSSSSARRFAKCIENDETISTAWIQLKEIFLRRNMEEMYLI